MLQKLAPLVDHSPNAGPEAWIGVLADKLLQATPVIDFDQVVGLAHLYLPQQVHVVLKLISQSSKVSFEVNFLKLFLLRSCYCLSFMDFLLARLIIHSCRGRVTRR